MRKIKVLGEDEGKIIERYLQSQQIDVTLRSTPDAQVELWVVEEKDLELAKEITAEFSKNPHDPKYRQVAAPPPKTKVQRTRYVDVRTQVFSRSIAAKGKVTFGLIIACIVIFLLLRSQLAEQVKYSLLFSKDVQPLFKEILEGQVWRLITPIFLHFGILHILFNMLWLYSLGNQIEQRNGSNYLLILILVIGVISNVGQYIWFGPLFGGFSGVVYGLLGYVWIMGRFKPSTGYEIDNFTLVFMIGLLILGVFGFIGNIANATHVLGLGSGVLWGLVASGHLRIPGRK